MVAGKSTTKYGVARGETIVGNLFSTIDEARRHLTWVEQTGEQLGIEPGTHRLVTVEEKTTYGRPHAYTEPTAPEDTEATTDTTTEPAHD